MERLLEEVWLDKGLEGKYLFERHIATSSMAVVVAARHLELEERVVIKFLSPDALRSNTAVSRFRSEAKAAAKIKSQHVVRIIDVSTTSSNVPYIVMEYLDGKDLEQLLAQFPERRAPVADAVDFILQASEAVCEGHSLGIVHRDLKPANLFCIDRGDGFPLIKVLGFGISKFTTLAGRSSAPIGTKSWDRHGTCPRNKSSQRRVWTRGRTYGHSASSCMKPSRGDRLLTTISSWVCGKRSSKQTPNRFPPCEQTAQRSSG